MFRTLKKFMLGRPLASKELCHQRLSKKVALAVFSSDALSSVAYATEEILIVLMLAGTGALNLSLPIALAIAFLLLILIISYSETIQAYPSGGGAYIVAKENLGKYPGLIAGASLLIDYVLTVAVSSASGVAAITSAFPLLYPYSVALCLSCIFLVTLINLRGVKESGVVFAVPTYLFIISFSAMILWGFYQYFKGGAHEQLFQQASGSLGMVNAFLLLRAFSSGCTALTGVEAISNGVPAFRAPEPRNAITTLVWMGFILLILFLGITELARFYQIAPLERETVVSQLAGQVFGHGFFYYLLQVSTALILLLAANTSFSDFPRLSSLIARDGFLPRQLASLGDRLAFSNGIISLGLAAGFLIVLFQANVHALIPLYAVGVFISFTLSQSGMVMHWFREKGKGWIYRIFINGLGALATALATLVIGSTKFTHGAWMVIVFIPFMIFIFLTIRHHYDSLSPQLSPKDFTVDPPKLHRVLIPLSAYHKGAVRALAYAKSISNDVRAVYVALDPDRTERFIDIWKEWGQGVQLVILESEYRSIVEPLVDYIDALKREETDQLITVVLPEFVPAKWWQQILHNQTALLIRGMLHFKKNVVVTSVRHFLEY
ncbi:MAG: APC family permease [Deltaproteobacteria bacterium]|nr:APC family permease [Deltaproteobacteria bacterium]